MENISSLILIAGYGAEVALVLALAGVAVLFRSMMVQDRNLREYKDLVNKLCEHVAQCAKDQITAHDHIVSLQEQCASLHARQHIVEKHGSDTQRIDLAMRMLKRGTGDSATLQDLGLSASEIKLLLRLHSAPAETGSSVELATESLKSQNAQELEAVSTSMSTQGQALAQMFRSKAG